MNIRILGLLAATFALAVVTVLAVQESGLMSIFENALDDWASRQVFLDLIIVAALAIGWMLNDAPKHGLPAWPFVLVTLGAGSFGPLGYLLVREWRRGEDGAG